MNKKLMGIFCFLSFFLILLITGSCKKAEDDIRGTWKFKDDKNELPLHSLIFSGEISTGTLIFRFKSCTFYGNYFVSEKLVDFSVLAPNGSDQNCDIEEGEWIWHGEFTDKDTITITAATIDGENTMEEGTGVTLIRQ